jgi:hypothetical protein
MGTQTTSGELAALCYWSLLAGWFAPFLQAFYLQGLQRDSVETFAASFFPM